jgi:hypothetical protein
MHRGYPADACFRHPGQSFADAVTPAGGPATHLQVKAVSGRTVSGAVR